MGIDAFDDNSAELAGPHSGNFESRIIRIEGWVWFRLGQALLVFVFVGIGSASGMFWLDGLFRRVCYKIQWSALLRYQTPGTLR